jgi:hypothetical protein
MAISNLVTSGQSFNRPSVSAFFGKAAPANDNLQKKSDMFSGDNFVTSITNMLQDLNSQLQKLQETSQKTILAFNKIIKDIRDVKKDIVSKFRIVNNELNSNKLDFVNGIRGGELPKPIEMPEPGTPVPANAPAAAAVPAATGGGLDLWDLLAGAGIAKDIAKSFIGFVPRLVAFFTGPVGGALLGGFAAFAAGMFAVADLADKFENWLGLKEKYKARQESDEYKELQKTQDDITNKARRTNVNRYERQKLLEKTLTENKLQPKDVSKLEGDILTTIDGRRFDILTQKPELQGPQLPSGGLPSAPAAGDGGGPSATAPTVSPPAPGGGHEGEQSKESAAGGGGGGGGAPMPTAAPTPAAGGGGAPAASPPMPMPAPAAPSTGTGGVGSIQAPGAGTPAPVTPPRATPAPETPPAPPPGTPVPTARPTGDELKSIGGIERTTPIEAAQQQAQQNVAAIQNPMALMAAKMEAAKQADEIKSKPAEPNTIIKGQEPVYTAAGDLAMPGTPDQKFVGSGRGSVVEGLNERANAEAIGSGRGSVIEKSGARAAANQPKPAAPTATPVVDPHAKSKALFQEVLDMEARGDGTGASVKFFEADKQRQAELAALKKPQPGTPAKKAESKPKKQKEMSAIPIGLGDESAGYTGAAGDILQAGLDQQAALNAGPEPGYSGKAGGTLQTNLNDMAVVEAEQQKERTAAAQKMQAIDDADMARAPGDKEKLAVMSEQQAKIEAGATPAQAGVRTVKGAGRIIGPKPADLEPPPKLSEQSSNEPIVQNNNQTQNSGTSTGGAGNNVAGQNLPMKATNDWLNDFIWRQQIIYQ